MSFSNTVKNDYFTYFTHPGGTAAHRDSVQIWNAKGLTISVQGKDWTPNGYNGFAKRHLLTTMGGKHEGNWEAKATRLNTKRAANPAQRRQPEFNRMVNSQIQTDNPGGFDMRTKEGRNQHGVARDAAKEAIKERYKTDPYGPQTEKVTVVVMDGMTRDQVADCFADAILLNLANWQTETAKTIRVEFPGDIVHTLEFNGATTSYPAISVSIHRGIDGIYYVYHCNGGSQ